MRHGFSMAVVTGLLAVPWGAVAGETPTCALDMIRSHCPAFAQDAGGSRVCRLDYAYRASAARVVFNQTAQALGTCLGKSAEPAVDIGVNHPDSYELKQFVAGDVVISVSLKDKASLDQTFVFLRIDPAPDH